MPAHPHPLPGVQVLAKPTGAIGNLDGTDGFALEKERLYPESRCRMSDAVLEAHVRQRIAAHRVPAVTLSWQGGEPTLMGLAFFRRVVACARQHQKPGTVIEPTLQTNGVLLHDAWCLFLREPGYRVGLSLDGPRERHAAYRVDRRGRPTCARVLTALRLLLQHEVAYNLLTTVHAANAGHPLEVYRCTPRQNSLYTSAELHRLYAARCASTPCERVRRATMAEREEAIGSDAGGVWGDRAPRMLAHATGAEIPEVRQTVWRQTPRLGPLCRDGLANQSGSDLPL